MNRLSVGDRVIFYVDESVAEHTPYHFKSKTFSVHKKEKMLVCQTFFLNYQVFSTKIWQFLHFASIRIIRIKCTKQFIMEINSFIASSFEKSIALKSHLDLDS